MTFLAPGWIKTRHGETITEGREAVALDATRLYEAHLDDVFRYVSRRLAARSDAEDVCAQVFAAAFEALPKFRGETAPRLWLLGIARRKVADALRRQCARREVEWPPELDVADPNGALSPSRALMREEGRAQIREVLAGLKDEQREALLLKYVEELSVAEIAQVMNRSHAAANSLLQRARAAAFQAGRAYFLPNDSDEVKP